LPLRSVFLAALCCLPVRAQPVFLACAPATPVAVAGETIRLFTWANPSGSAKPVYAWTVSSGEVRTAGGNIFTWNPAAGSSGPSSADGELRTDSAVQARCLVEVQVVASRSAAADDGLLLPGSTEADGAGLYNYLLISAPPDHAKHEVFRSALNAWLPLNSPVATLRGVLKPNEPIALALPVLEKPVTPPDADWLLQHFDYARARTLLDKVFPGGKPGLYIVSSLLPLPKSKPPYLVQDLSAATPALAASWVEAFINEAAQEHTWNSAEEASLVDQIRATVLAIAGEASNIKLPLLMKWIALL